MDQLNVTEKGLTKEEAENRLVKYGPNELLAIPGPSPLAMFAAQFKDFLVIILLFAAGISAIVTHLENLLNGTADLPLDTIVIMVIVILNAIMGFIQEYRAEKAIEALKEMAAPRAHVIREGNPVDVPSREVVPGDILRLETGDRLPADSRIIESHNLYTDEASLTGESLPVKKNAQTVLTRNVPIADRVNMVHSGTVITSGRGLAVVCRTGMNTEIGRIAEMIQAAEEKETPLQKRMEKLGKQLGIGILIICMVVFGVQVIFQTAELISLFITAVALAVAAIPEGLPAVVTITLALGVQRMIKRNAIIRRLPAVETLGAATVICSDKTGTLTKDEMTVRVIYVPDRLIYVTGIGYEPKGNFVYEGNPINPLQDSQIHLLLQVSRLCNNAIVRKQKKNWEVFGDPTEGALFVVAQKAGIDGNLLKDFPRIAELPFDAARKLMSTIHDTPDGNTIAYVKGAPEVVLKRCSHILTDEGLKPLTERARASILANNDKMATQALRVLAMAFRILPETLSDISPQGVENDLVFVGLAGMMDPPRPEVREAIKLCRRAGITPVMITGDHQYTAVAVADELGMFKEDDVVLTGEALDSISDEDLADVVLQVRVYARVSPEHKLRIVRALKQRGAICAMTGDGVNDAPALKNADIGIAMGITGTDVTKEASDMILTDDNFASIVNAIEEGRGIADNTRKFVSYLLSCNAGEILVIFLASVLFIGWPLPLLAIQILFVNLVTDGLPALALGMEPIEKDVMERHPQNPEEGVLTGAVWIQIWIVGITIAFATLGLYWLEIMVFGGGITSSEVIVRARTIAFTALVFMQMIQALNSRSGRQSLLKVGIFGNRVLLLAILSSMGLHALILYQPFLASVFHVAPLSLLDWLIILAVSLSVFIVVELIKLIGRKWLKGHKQELTTIAPTQTKSDRETDKVGSKNKHTHSKQND
ncbi:MAG: calcium-translocating P-type ATPase, SERCA-type [Promethearchaeota archaeon]